MFEDSTFASSGRPGGRRGWTALFSFAVQGIALGIAVLAPLLYTDALPLNLTRIVEISPPPAPSAPQPPNPVRVHPQSEIVDNVLVQPHTIPPRIAHVVDDRDNNRTGDQAPVIGAPPGGFGNGSTFINNLLANTHHAAPVAASVQPRTARVSAGVIQGLLVRKVTPIYPPLAKAAGIQGPVVLQATISREGVIENLQVLSGHPMLVKAALEAVEQWRYRPYLLDHQPVEVETQITVNFRLGG